MLLVPTNLVNFILLLGKIMLSVTAFIKSGTRLFEDTLPQLQQSPAVWIIYEALLTQNTSWMQVEKALLNLKRLNALYPEAVISFNSETLKEAIRPAGYYN